MLPSLPPLHNGWVTFALAEIILGWVKVNEAVPVHEFPSVIVTVYVPATNPLMSSVAAVLLHKNV